ncbi:tripartite tricarboxylate transporter permease [Paucibacter sp. B2R-40]|uniref:tripartite tricarboxylate transporter permease n=1 Tax=Paucibacter sp. B2R-40 TaxID=2893554 RepID=UPI0021E44E6A|nr:tripartite tricarboxylate transporter permease [Paucibacter sp. B2R-40]MCV2354788.1 tripartite tricarboxylate transporter permease [Paucibacter sp. B2R-40]
MEDFGNLVQGFGVAMSLPNLGYMLIGITLGVLIGVLPGLGGANGVAILLPLTFTMAPTSAIIMLSCIYWGALFGGAITSILFNIPGEPWSVATTFDGYPMARDGRAAQALATAFTSSFVGALFAVILITFLAPLLARFALNFGPSQMFAVQFLTFCSFVGMSREPPLRTLAAMLLGFALATVGMDTVSGQLRMTYGTTVLLKGFDFLIAVIGLFGIGEILLTMEEGLAFKGQSAHINPRVVWQTWAQLIKHWRVFLRSTLIGCWMGITPGGATPASFMSYGMARRFSKHPEKFGKGAIEGVIAPETAAHAAGTAALLPMLTLGIPGSPTAAVLLGGLLIWGLQPGPMLFVEQKEFVWGLIASMYLGNLVGLLVVLTTVPFWAAILRIPFSLVAPMIIVLCAVGAYTVHSSMFDVGMMLVFGVMGYLFKKLRYPLAPLVLALVLGDMAETNFRQSMLSSQGSLGIFWSGPLVGTLMSLALLLLCWPLLGLLRERLRRREIEADSKLGPASRLEQAKK